ncbi:MAG: hypothetical protein ACJATI_004985 [Halioglobus sp.]|jgi:hypothetical protein
MSKSTHFSGQPILAQLLELLDKGKIASIVSDQKSDRYYKKFKTYEHLVTMMFACLSNSVALRELSTSMMACEGRLNHLGIDYSPKRSTISDGNKNRSSSVFESIYQSLYTKYGFVLSDSVNTEKLPKGLKLADSTTIGLFKEILKTSGRKRIDGKQKGGIKAHTVIDADKTAPSFIHFTSAATHDSCLLDELKLEEGDFICFDKAYIDYKLFYKWTEQGISMVTRMKDNAIYESVEELDIPDSSDDRIIKDEIVTVQTENNLKKAVLLKLRRVAFYDKAKDKVYVFMCNNLDIEAEVIANIYKRRWYIETYFRKLKQNFPLKYFLGDNQNAIEIQIWVSHIVMLLIEVLKKKVTRKWAFSNMVSMLSTHIMSYIDAVKFLNNPEKAWSEKKKQNIDTNQLELKLSSA